MLKRGKRACRTPRLDARRFEKLVVGEIRENILTEGNIKDLVSLDGVETVTALAKDMSEWLKESGLAERRAFTQSFVKEIVVGPGEAKPQYTIPRPQESHLVGIDAEVVAIPEPVLSTVNDGSA